MSDVPLGHAILHHQSLRPIVRELVDRAIAAGIEHRYVMVPCCSNRHGLGPIVERVGILFEGVPRDWQERFASVLSDDASDLVLIVPLKWWDVAFLWWPYEYQCRTRHPQLLERNP